METMTATVPAYWPAVALAFTFGIMLWVALGDVNRGTRWF